MPKPLPAEKRAAILDAIKAGGSSRNQIARDHDVSTSTVTGIAKDAGLHSAFDRSLTENATRARVIDCKALREQLKGELLVDALRLKARAWKPYQVVVSTPQGADIVTLDQPPLAEVRSAYTALGIAIDKSLVLERHDSIDSAADAKSMLGSLSEALGVAARSLPDETPEPE